MWLPQRKGRRGVFSLAIGPAGVLGCRCSGGPDREAAVPITPQQEQRLADLWTRLERGEISQREIGRLAGVSRCTVEAIKDGRRPLDFARAKAAGRVPPAAVQAKCPTCGAKCEQPCLACQLRKLAQANRPRPTRDDGEPLTIALQDEDHERYLIERHAVEGEMFRDFMVGLAEQRVAATPDDAEEPTDDELAAIDEWLDS